MNYGTSVSKPQFDSSSSSLTSTAPSNSHSEPTRSNFPFDSQFGNFQHAMPFGPFGHVPYYSHYGIGGTANPQGGAAFGESAMSKQGQSPSSPSPSSSHLVFNNTYSSMYSGQQSGSVAQGYPPGIGSTAFSYPLMNNGNLAPSPLSSAKGDLMQDSPSHGSPSIGSDISSHGSPGNDC